MIEISTTYDLLPGIDQQGYAAYCRKAIGAILQAPGCVEVRANRNMLGSPHVRFSVVWQTLGDWAGFMESAEWQALEVEFAAFKTNSRSEIWGASPVLPKPMRPDR